MEYFDIHTEGWFLFFVFKLLALITLLHEMSISYSITSLHTYGFGVFSSLCTVPRLYDERVMLRLLFTFLNLKWSFSMLLNERREKMVYIVECWVMLYLFTIFWRMEALNEFCCSLLGRMLEEINKQSLKALIL